MNKLITQLANIVHGLYIEFTLANKTLLNIQSQAYIGGLVNLKITFKMLQSVIMSSTVSESLFNRLFSWWTIVWWLILFWIFSNQDTFLTFPKLTEDVYRLYTLVFNLRYSVQQYNLYFFYIFLGGKVWLCRFISQLYFSPIVGRGESQHEPTRYILAQLLNNENASHKQKSAKMGYNLKWNTA